jgi:hypothetical protein
MLQGYIVDPETGKVVAVIRHGEVFRDDKEGAKIATVLNANLYDLSGNLVGRLGPNAIDVRTWSMPIAVSAGLTCPKARPLSTRRGREDPCADRPIENMARDHDAGGQGEPHAARMGELLFGRRRQQGVHRLTRTLPVLISWHTLPTGGLAQLLAKKGIRCKPSLPGRFGPRSLPSTMPVETITHFGE